MKMTLTSFAPRAGVDISKTSSTWIPQDAFLGSVDEIDDNAPGGDGLDLDMEWRVWEEFAGDIQPSFDSWKMEALEQLMHEPEWLLVT